MGKFFKGIAAVGAWCCLDEFNRINVEVLEVVAAQILVIQNAKKERAYKFNFEGTRNLRLKSDANIFITMNPSYGGRQELPANLAALFAHAQ